MKTRRYSEMRLFDTFEERFEYLKLVGEVGKATFGFDRWVNQQFYNSYEWKQARNFVIMRDEGCDLGVPGHEVHERLMVHHMNPILPDDLMNGSNWVLDAEFLVVVSHRTHNAIHYGDESLLARAPVQRRPGDTKLW